MTDKQVQDTKWAMAKRERQEREDSPRHAGMVLEPEPLPKVELTDLDQPLPGVVYALFDVGNCIANGNTLEESRVA
jgi:hypothetical protein